MCTSFYCFLYCLNCFLIFYNFFFSLFLMYFCLVHLLLLLLTVPISLYASLQCTAAWISVIMISFYLSPLSRCASLTVSAAAFSVEAQPAQRVGDLLCGWETFACETHSGPRAVGFSPPLNLCSFSLCSLHFSFFLPFFSQFLRWGKNLRCGLFVLVWCRFSHVLGRHSYLHDRSLDWEGLSWYHVRSCVLFTPVPF